MTNCAINGMALMEEVMVQMALILPGEVQEEACLKHTHTHTTLNTCQSRLSPCTQCGSATQSMPEVRLVFTIHCCHVHIEAGLCKVLAVLYVYLELNNAALTLKPKHKLLAAGVYLDKCIKF